MNHRVIIKTTSVIEIAGAASFEDATKMAMKQVEGPGGIIVSTNDIDDMSTFSIDEMGVAHDEKCPGTHCRHYGCLEEEDEGERWYCTQCDPEDDDS